MLVSETFVHNAKLSKQMSILQFRFMENFQMEVGKFFRRHIWAFLVCSFIIRENLVHVADRWL